MTTTYRAVQAVHPGRLELVEREMPAPGDGEVLLEVEACGVCGADAADIKRVAPGQPRVPGHEAVGRITALGPGVPSLWRIGQRVGVGRMGGHCGLCGPCRQGHFNLCANQPVVGATCDGGYAEMMVARSSGLVAIPEELDSQDAAPILCAGIATFNALRKCGAEAGDLVAVLGIGGLGHMAVQYARRMGFKVVAAGRGQDIAQAALGLGAHIYVDTAREALADALSAMGGAQAIIATIGDAGAAAAAMAGLAPRGRMVLLGICQDALPVLSGHLVGGERSVMGSITGSPHETERALRFSVLADALPRIETLPLERAEEAYRRMRSGEVEFRMVLTMDRADRRG
ncbi:alcohol dehydrogenase catalytic domain-containing protein [Achromobacter agilis]|uniref:Alcohol dehydrogenase n=1 Tax=Achromobacter agilis TaxID=1353888 RepID=A0A446CAP6_9BURK|nr:alcohol dehydrogenase catalytic domain-containing protein [Achromobacter agilis]SSW64977.1 Alcohol dehydrogenase [Achromobacter agilis]